MSARTILVVGLAGIATFVVLALIGVRVAGGGDVPPSGAPAAPALAEPPPVPPAREAAATVEGPIRPPAPPLHSVAPARTPMLSEDGAAAWDAVPLALRPAGLGRDLAAPVANGLAAARASMAPCFGEERRRLAGADPEPVPAGAFGPAVLVVRLEAEPGKLIVAGTELASRGTSSRELIECCRRALAGWEIDAPGAKPPARYRVQQLVQ